MLDISGMKRLKLAGRIVEKLIGLIWIGICILGVILCLGEVVLVFLPKDIWVIDLDALPRADVLRTLTRDMAFMSLEDQIYLQPLLLYLIPVGILWMGLYGIQLWSLKQILVRVIGDRPFDQDNARALSLMGISLLVFGLVMQYVSEWLFIKGLGDIGIDLSVLLTYAPNYTMVFSGILLIILAGVFSYGAYLQVSYDETV